MGIYVFGKTQHMGITMDTCVRGVEGCYSKIVTIRFQLVHCLIGFITHKLEQLIILYILLTYF